MTLFEFAWVVAVVTFVMHFITFYTFVSFYVSHTRSCGVMVMTMFAKCANEMNRFIKRGHLVSPRSYVFYMSCTCTSAFHILLDNLYQLLLYLLKRSVRISCMYVRCHHIKGYVYSFLYPYGIFFGCSHVSGFFVWCPQQNRHRALVYCDHPPLSASNHWFCLHLHHLFSIV